MIQIDDLWLASYLMSQGARLTGCLILPYNSGSRMRAVFELNEVPGSAMQQYSQGDPPAPIHQVRIAMNRLRDLMYAELEKRNGKGGIKTMPNGGGNGGQRSDGQRRRGEHETGAIRNR
jgi:hypothetical protein